MESNKLVEETAIVQRRIHCNETDRSTFGMPKLFRFPMSFIPHSIGLSIDSNFAHLAWVRNIKKNFGVEIPFPVIEDLSMRVANAYGMIQPGASDTSAVRATFIIDPDSVLRAMVYYPMSNGRSIDEFLRLLTGLQTSDAHGVATPEGWQPGDKVMVPPPKTAAEAEERLQAGYECADWYFCKRAV